MSDNKSVTVNMSWLGLLGVVLVTLKATNVIDWSWWWVLAPFYAPLLLVAGIFAVAAVCVVIVESRK